ncbi:MAG: glycosyltransferase [Cyanobacteria bacterium P01_D01_bin.123]
MISTTVGDGACVLSLVVPTYNEHESLPYLLKTLSDLLDRALPDAYELIVVDDDSPDRTWELAESLQASIPSLKVIRRVRDKVLATAVRDGWLQARGEILGAIDGDLQHPPEVVLELIDRVRAGADLAIASRNVEGGGVSEWSLARRIVSRGAQLLGLLVLPGVLGQVSDPMSGYFLVRRTAIAGAALDPVGYKILLEVIARGRIARISEVGYVFQERQEGESKVSYRHYFDYLFHLWRLRLALWPVGRFLRFGIVGGSGVLVDMACLFAFHDSALLGWPLTPSKILAAECAILNNFLLNDRWTFADRARQQHRFTQTAKRWLKFNLICSLGLVLNLAVLQLLTRGLGLHYLAGNAIAIGLVTFWNFWLNLKLNWRVTDVGQSK